MASTWDLKGVYFESCNCESACPCVFLNDPTGDDCKALLGWHVEAGSFDGVSLDDLNVAMALHSPGHMAEVQWTVALYVDGKANDDQKNALTAIFGGQAGGHPATLASHVGEILGVASAAIDFRADGRRRSLKIDRVADVEIVGIEGQGGASVEIHNHPLAVAPGYPLTAARSSAMTYADHGLQWEFTDKNGFFSPFHYSAA